MPELMRLKIPIGWVMLDNKLYDTEPIPEESNNRIKNWHEGFIEDVLWILEFQLNDNGEYEFPKTNHYSIDLSWLPDGDINGHFYAKLSWCEIDSMDQVEKFESKNRFEIRDKIEFWMKDITDNHFEYHTRMKT